MSSEKQKTFSKLIMKTFVIGIGGVTNGGKTTLAKNLQKHLPNCSVISQDDFFKPESEIETDKNGFLQYDVLEALNMEKMMATISCWMENPRHSLVSTDWGSSEEIPILIIEGFLLFNYKPLDTIWNRSYFVTIPYEECKRRRSTRVYTPPDPPGYFDGHVWPMYLKHRQEMEDITWEIGKCPFSLHGRPLTYHCLKVHKQKDIRRHISHVLHYKGIL
ncbi:nicotinamide riboside kinase 1 isoform X1 [Saccopteryx leptura]|uniref:nicotinamide riboside kinase 1 isoform X1 n=2 Tax=Saccopteryx leptura TaxID=249018 RepID=UPI00339BB391